MKNGDVLKNGATVLDYHYKAYEEVGVVLARTDGFHPYVTWMVNPKDGSTFWGHYCETLNEAIEDFEERIR